MNGRDDGAPLSPSGDSPRLEGSSDGSSERSSGAQLTLGPATESALQLPAREEAEPPQDPPSSSQPSSSQPPSSQPPSSQPSSSQPRAAQLSPPREDALSESASQQNPPLATDVSALGS